MLVSVLLICEELLRINKTNKPVESYAKEITSRSQENKQLQIAYGHMNSWLFSSLKTRKRP